MPNAKTIADHWGRGDVYGLIVSALNKMSNPLEGLTIEELAPEKGTKKVPDTYWKLTA